MLQKQASNSNKSPRSSQRVSSPNRKRQCSGVSHDDMDSGALGEQEEDAAAHLTSKGSDSGRVDLQAIAAGV